MCIRINTYELLVHELGEEIAFKVCETFAGIDLKIPKKAHKTYRIKEIVKRHLKLLQEEDRKTKFVKFFSAEMQLSKRVIYKIIQEVEDELRK
ncbi:hypothetical protein [Halarcobacter anaerophilus]|uniref:Mor transcription activator domain-containing protein n=1 Tax=Halarcobacter anaerophilus TaxID=877500 RepID=A0A4Q0Y0V6_9BACT|nr:hypothetical protein [Halarcobacter anaerophilus]QDF30188.1 hypothetical protein AANAER_2745 [Halarcobacter anaerophilus]RXJ62249.1 hypothetical protein CRV06_10835 [Halarcobacter anaerophilus]